jgi:hypothetical protein
MPMPVNDQLGLLIPATAFGDHRQCDEIAIADFGCGPVLFKQPCDLSPEVVGDDVPHVQRSSKRVILHISSGWCAIGLAT